MALPEALRGRIDADVGDDQLRAAGGGWPERISMRTAQVQTPESVAISFLELAGLTRALRRTRSLERVSTWA